MPSVFRKSATAMRLDSVAGGREYELPPSSGGSRIKRLQVMVKLIDATTPATDKLQMKIQTGPDGVTWKDHTAYSTLAAATDDLWVLDSDATVSLSEHWRVVLKTDTSAGQTLIVDVFETGKPF